MGRVACAPAGQPPHGVQRVPRAVRDCARQHPVRFPAPRQHRLRQQLTASLSRSLAQRLRAAVAAQPGHLAAVTLGSACFSAVFLLMFVGFQVGKLPLASFPVRDARGAKYATLSLGVGAALVGCLAWRGAVAAQPAAEVRRTLLSAPDQKSGEREPLLQLRVDEGPPPPGWRPALEAARRAAARDARLAAVAAATRAHAAAVAASPARTATSATPRIYHDDARPVRW